MDNNNKNFDQLNVESKYLSFNYRKKIITYEENFLLYLANLEKDNKNIKLRKLNFRSVNKKMKEK